MTKQLTTNSATMGTTVVCPDGTRAINGFNGVLLSTFNSNRGVLNEYGSYASTDSKTWRFVFEMENSTDKYTGTLGVICAKV
ncbi:hypothetical protein ACXNSR_20865 [Streptomyces sp. NC-S4]